jgi:hypothetical protein
MNYKDARQRKTDLRWDYTNHNNRTGTGPIGYCGGWAEFSEETIQMFYPGGRESPHFQKEDEARRRFKDKYHSDGHATKEEAYACYKEYCLDHELVLDLRMSGEQRPCKVCGAWTQGLARVGAMRYFTLCDEHRTREEVAKLFEVGESWGSY